MSRESYSGELVKLALSAAEGMVFERFAQELFAHLTGGDFVPTGGQRDGGADGVLEGLSEVAGKADRFFQASVRKDTETKIRQTVARLIEVGREVKQVTYFTSQTVNRFDLVEATLSDELDVTIRIRDSEFIAAHVNDNPTTVDIFRRNLAHYVAYLQQVGSSRLIPVSAHVKSPAVYTFLAQEIERRNGDTSSLDAMVDALALWALEGTDPDKGIFMTRDEVMAKILEELPSVESLVAKVLGTRLEELSEKGTRLVRWHRKEDLFCLPYETRLTIESDNAADVLLEQAMLRSLRDRIEEEDRELGSAELDVASTCALRAIQATFEYQGLEFASFLRDPAAVAEHPEIATSISQALESNGIQGALALRLSPSIFQGLRRLLYGSTETERQYLQRLSNTYTLLFILNTEPRLLQFFQEMTGDFYLYVGSDQLLKALSEQYLDESDQMGRNALRIASKLGATLVLTQPVLEEVISHFRRCDFEWKNHISASESFMNYELARNVGPIMLRAYLYARINPTLQNKPKSWQSFVNQFCNYDDLHKPSGEGELLGYLVKKFAMEFAASEDLEDLVDMESVAELARELEPGKARRELADNDALLAHAVYGRRTAEKELASQNEFGFSTWWLTGEASILKHTRELVKANRGARYMMRPEFLLHFVTLAPSAKETRDAFARIFPTLLGIKLAKRLDESAFHGVMDKVDEAAQLDDARRSTAIATIVDKLKGDFARSYIARDFGASTGSIDVIAASQHEE